MIDIKEIRAKMIKAIEESNIEQKKIAEQLRITPSNISQYKKGLTMPGLDTFANLCDILDISPSEILGTKN